MSFRGELSLAADLREVTRLNDWLEAAFVCSGLLPSVAADLKLCLNEIVVNLISYAFSATARPLIAVEVMLGPELAVANIRDNGTYFDLRDWKLPERPKDVHEAPIGGYGILLIRDRASSIAYERRDGVNTLRITCHARGGASEQPKS